MERTRGPIRKSSQNMFGSKPRKPKYGDDPISFGFLSKDNHSWWMDAIAGFVVGHWLLQSNSLSAIIHHNEPCVIIIIRNQQLCGYQCMKQVSLSTIFDRTTHNFGCRPLLVIIDHMKL